MVASQTLSDAALTCYALPPLSLTLLSGELSVRPYLTGQNPPLGDEPHSLAFDGVDLDVWLTTFLGAVEALLTTEYAAAAEFSHAASLTAVREAKLRLAAILADRAQPLFADAPGTTEARDLAVDSLITMLLKSLVSRDVVVAADGLSVPPPRCVHPDPVTLISQQAVQSVDEPVSAADLTSWHVSVLFAHSGSDSYAVQAAFNTCASTENDSSLLDDSLARLFRALAEFVTAWPMLTDDLAVLPTLSDGGTAENATVALRAFAMLVDTVTSALAGFVSPILKPDSALSSPASVDEGGTRRAEIGGLNVLRQASALAGVAVLRNAELLPGRVTNPAFVYRGPSTRFHAEVMPVICGGAPIDISAISVGEALGTFLRDLLDVTDCRPVLRLAATCSESAIPILLLPSVAFRPTDWDWTVPGTVVYGVDDMVSLWLEAHSVSTGTIRFDLSVFGGDKRSKPLIRDVTLLYPLE